MPRRWEQEAHRKLYVRVDAKWLLLPVLARGLGSELLKYANDLGQIEIGNEPPGDAIARMLSAHRAEYPLIRKHVAALLVDGYLVLAPGVTTVRNFVEAQGRGSNAERQARWREARRASAEANAGDAPVDPVGDVTSNATDNVSSNGNNNACVTPVLQTPAVTALARALSLSSGSDLDSGSGSPALDLLKLSGSDARQTNPRAKSGRGKGVQKPKTECPSSVDLGAAEWLRGHGIPLGVEANKMLDHHVANGIQRRDWPATWRNWNVRSAEYGAKNGGSSRPHGAHDIQSEPDYDHERERQTREAHLAEAAAKTAAYEADCVARGVSPVPF